MTRFVPAHHMMQRNRCCLSSGIVATRLMVSIPERSKILFERFPRKGCTTLCTALQLHILLLAINHGIR
jgi:hypothetical protein